MGLWDTISGAASSATNAVTSTVSKAVTATTSAASSAASSVTHAVGSTVDTIEKAAPKAAVTLATVAKSGLDEAENLAKKANSAAASFSKENDPFNFGAQYDQYKQNPLGKLLSNLNPLNPVKQAAAIGYDTVASAVGDVKNIAKNPQSASDVLQAFNPVSQGAALLEVAAAAASPSAKHWLEKTASGSSPLKELPGLGDVRIASNPKAALASGLSELDLGLDVASVTGIGDIAKGAELGIKGAAGDSLERGLSESDRAVQGGIEAAGTPKAPSFPKLLESAPPAVPKDGVGSIAKLHLPDVNPEQGGLNCQYCTREVDAALSGKPTRFPQTGPDHGVPEAYTPGAPETDAAKWADQFKQEVGSPNNWDFKIAHDAAGRDDAIDSITTSLANPGDRGSIYVSSKNGAHILNVANFGGKVIAIDGQTGIYGDIATVLKKDGYQNFDQLGYLKSN